MNKPHHMKGKQYALKDQRGVADSWLQIRLPKKVKGIYVRRARARGMNLSEWVIMHLDRADKKLDDEADN